MVTDQHLAGPDHSIRAQHEDVEVTLAVSEAEWDGFVESHPSGTIDHVWRWRHVFDDVFGHQSTYLAARRQGTLVGVLPLVRIRSRLFGRSLVSVPFLNYGGILASDPQVAAALTAAATDAARQFGAAYVELRHTARQCPHLPSRQHKLALTRPLPRDHDALWGSLDRKVRNQVRKAQKDGLTTEVGDGTLIDAFYSVFARNMRDLGTPVYARQLFVETLRLFGCAARVVIVRSGSSAVAAGIVLRFRDTAVVPWASSLREYRAQCPNMLLYWSMMTHAIDDGARVFDFGRSSPGSGPHAFKRQWGAEEVPLNWEYALLTRRTLPDTGASNPRFAAAIDLWKRLPLWVANQVGPVIVRTIP